jgi:hypothetical protein
MNLRSFVKLGLMLIAASALWFSAWASLTRGEDNAASPRGNPILANLKITPELEWVPDGLEHQPPSLKINLVFHGIAASLASQILAVRLESILDERGKSYIRRCWDSTPSSSRPDSPESVRFAVEISNRPPMQMIRKLRGSILLQIDRQRQEIILKNAFKELGKPIKDDALESLKISVVPNCSRKAQWDPASRFREHVSISIRSSESPDPNDAISKIVDFDVADDEGSVPRQETTVTRDRASMQIRFGCQVEVRPETELRLTVQRGAGTKEVWIPFAMKDVTVPRVPSNLDTPSVLSEESVEAEPVSLDDPIVAGLKMNVEVEPSAVLIRLQGKPIEQTSRFGEVDLDSVLDEAGHKVYLCNSAVGMMDRFNERNFHAHRPAAYFWITDADRPKKLRELRGSVALRTGGRREPVVVKEFLKSVGKPIKNQTLENLGISVRLLGYEKDLGPEFGGRLEELDLEFVLRHDMALYRFDLLDPQGQPVGKGEVAGFRKNNTVTCTCFCRERLPAGCQLRIVVHKDSRKVRVPFVFKDIKIPPAAKEQE